MLVLGTMYSCTIRALLESPGQKGISQRAEREKNDQTGNECVALPNV